jgi:hypothetical protein
MRLSRIVLVAAAFLSMSFWRTGSAVADIVYLSDGTWIRGTILKETKDDLEIDGKTNTGITIKATIQKSRVSSILRTDTPAGEPAKDGTPATGEPKTDKPASKDGDKTDEKAASKAGDFLVIPLTGTFGEDIVPMGVKPSLEWAVKNKVKHIVFTIDSDGGQVWAAEAIRDMMVKHENDLTYHMVIKKAMSASIWVVFTSHRIAALPASTLGAAVAFSRNTTGEAEVDEKLNSALAARLASAAEARGHSGHLVRAMILTKYDLFAAKGEDGKWRIVHDRPNNGQVETLSDGTRVVTLTADEMDRYGVASKLASGADKDLAKWLGDDKLVSSGNRGEIAMKKAVSETKSVAKQIENWANQVVEADAAMQQAVKADDVDAAIRAVENYLRQVRKVGALRNKAESLNMAAYPAFKRIDVEKDVKNAEDALSQLRNLKRQRQGGR